jgi:hypothetical protein
MSILLFADRNVSPGLLNLPAQDLISRVCRRNLLSRICYLIDGKPPPPLLLHAKPLMTSSLSGVFRFRDVLPGNIPPC